jgi:hypothetical protein
VRRYPILRNVLALWWKCCKPAIKLILKVVFLIFKKLTLLKTEMRKIIYSVKNKVELKFKGKAQK